MGRLLYTVQILEPGKHSSNYTHMRFLLALIVLVIIVGIFLYFLPGSVHIEKSMVLKARPQVVFNTMNNPSEWKKWADWLHADPDNTITYNGPSTGAGARLSWNSPVPEYASGDMLIESAQEPNQLKATINFSKYGTATNAYSIENTGNGTRVTWIFDLNVASKSFLNKVKIYSWRTLFANWLDASLRNLDESTAAMPDYPAPVQDSLRMRVDSLSSRLDSLRKTGKDTVYVP